MLECERLFGLARGREIQELAEAVTGGPCPCMAGAQACPLASLYIGADGSPKGLSIARRRAAV